MQDDKKRNNEINENEILEELKQAYKSVNALKVSPAHRKILLDVERKIRKENGDKQKQEG